MNIIESTVVRPTRRITIELPDDRAEALALYLGGSGVWSRTPVANELEALHRALGGWDGSFTKAAS